ncbi:MAG: flagellar motor protein MotB [Gammaproteobacteria bacterium]|nr:flagellar motor protein MotB [Gammaproteobacteria bacterium]
MDNKSQPIIVIKKKGHGHGAHGGAWKVAFADFMTAMMAFFLLLWVLETTTEAQKRAISGYFQDPGGALIGPGGSSPGVIDLEKPHKEPNPPAPKTDLSTGPAGEEDEDRSGAGGENDEPGTAQSEEQLRKQLEKKEQEQLEELKKQLEGEIEKIDSVFNELKDQILIDYTALGLRIQIVDKEQRPMFDSGSARMKPYSRDVMASLAPLIDKVPNKISVTGHTDATPYGSGASYTNWELSADRANSARRALQEGGYPEGKMATVQGMGSASPFLPESPTDPINRRIAIIVLKKAVADALGRNSGVSAEALLKPTPIPQEPLPELDAGGQR